MTQEEKAKRYDEAIERAKAYQGLRSEMEIIFPELKESKGERIREKLVQFFKEKDEEDFEEWVPKAKVLAWLEARGEQKPVISYDALREGIGHFGITQYQIDNWLKKYVVVEKQCEQKPTEEYNITGIGSKNAQGKLGKMIKNLKPVSEVLEQKSAWSEKYIADVFEKVGLAKIAREQENDSLTRALQSAMIELAKYSVVPQIRQEWSEEDEKQAKQIEISNVKGK